MKKISNYYKNHAGRILQRVHVAYQFSKGKKSGFGHIELTVKKNLTSKDIADYLESEYGFDGVVVISWQPMKMF